jgi:hypothetical protein
MSRFEYEGDVTTQLRAFERRELAQIRGDLRKSGLL